MTHAAHLNRGHLHGRRRAVVGPPPKLLLDEHAFRVGPGRRALDLAVASTMLVLTAPVVLAAAALVFLTDRGSPVYWQVRLGEQGKPFRMMKLRSMRPTPAAPAGASSTSGPEITAHGDGRVTRIGRLLRRTSIDELPQLWHVLRGEMTLVGPRPETVGLAARYPLSCRPVLAARPGLTGPAQLAYRERSAVPPDGWDDVEAWYLEVLVPLRTAADLEFLLRPTVGRTLRYLALTGGFVLGMAHTERQVLPPVLRRPPPAQDEKKSTNTD